MFFKNVYYYKGNPYNENTIIASDATRHSFTELKDRNTYNTWSNFDNNWKLETINGIARIPLLKNASIEYSNYTVDEINININETANLYDYITPNNDLAKNVAYTISGDTISINDGVITGVKHGQSTLHILSYYDGYEKDITVNSIDNRTFKINYIANNALGVMDSEVVLSRESHTLLKNQFNRPGYTFNNWNTKEDGTG